MQILMSLKPARKREKKSLRCLALQRESLVSQRQPENTAMIMTMHQATFWHQHCLTVIVTDLYAVNDGLEILSLSMLFWLPYFFCPGAMLLQMQMMTSDSSAIACKTTSIGVANICPLHFDACCPFLSNTDLWSLLLLLRLLCCSVSALSLQTLALYSTGQSAHKFMSTYRHCSCLHNSSPELCHQGLQEGVSIESGESALLLYAFSFSHAMLFCHPYR